MAGVTQTIPQYSLGISEQPDNLKFPGQVSDSINAIPDVTKGLFKRPGAKRMGTDALSNVYSNQNHATNKNGSWFHYYRDEIEGSYIGQVDINGQVRVWRCSDGQLMTTAFAISKTITITSAGSGYSTAPTVTFSAPQTGEATNRATGVATINSSGQLTGITVTDTGTGYTSAPSITITGNATATCVLDNTFVQNYLATDEPENLQFLTINDTTFANSRDTTNANTLIGTTGTTDTTPDPHFAFIELLRTENGRQYGLNISNNTNTTILNRATRIEIQSDTLDESDGTGHCPGIGTQVFSANYSLNDTSATFATSDVAGGTNNLVTVTTSTPHKLITGNFVSISANATQSQFVDLPNVLIAVTGDDTFTYVADSDQGDHTTTACTVTHNRNNLIFRLNVLGQQGVSPNYGANSDGAGGQDYRCSYNREAILLHGGEGWVTGDTVTVSLTSASGGGPMRIKWDDADSYVINTLVSNNGNSYRAKTNLGNGNTEPTHSSSAGDTAEWEFIGNTEVVPATYTIKVVDHEQTSVQANVNSSNTGLIRPAPTPFDAQTAVTADAILGSLKTEIDAISGISAKIIGSGLYLFSDNEFNVEIVEEDLMRVMQSSVNDVTNLPNQCKHGYIVKISNSRMADEDDYYVRFDGENNQDGTGSWSECAKPGIPKTLTNMPLVIERTALTAFTVKQFTYEDRRVGDKLTNPLPSFVGKRINKVLFFRNRLALLSGENVITSRPGTLPKPDFFAESALTTSASDPIDISAASMFPSELFDGIEINTGLLVFSTNQQFLLASDDTVLNPDTAKLRSVSTFNYNETIAPISLGTTVAYIDNSGKFSRFNEMANVQREGEPNVVEVSKIVPTLLPKNIDLITNSRENSIVLMGKTNSDIVFGYKYLQIANKRQQAAWFRWKLNNPLIYHFIINDEYFFLDSDYYLQSIKLVQADSDPFIVQDNVDFLLHVDNHTTVSGGNFNPITNTTTFSGVGWLNTVTSPNYDLVVIDTNSASARVGRYAKPTVSGTSFTLPGDWENVTLTIGYIYDYEVTFPTFYPTKGTGDKIAADVNSSLILHRIKLHFGKIGLYETILKRVGKKDYKEVYESTELDEYKASDAPYLEEFIKTVPIYEKNTNVDVILRSSHPAPATLRALSWEGDYSPKFYQRV